MGLLSQFIRRLRPPSAVIVEAIERLQVGIMTNLLLLYSSQMHDKVEALNLASCVLSHALCMEPLSAEEQYYQKDHSELIDLKARQLVELPEVAEAFSFLYAALTIHIAIRTRHPLSEAAVQLGNRATELSFYIPNTYDICGTEDHGKCIRAIAAFADNYSKRVSGR